MNYIIKYSKRYIVGMIVLCSLVSCGDFLDEKPEKAMVIPSSYADLQALLDDDGRMNSTRHIGLLEIGADNYYLNQDVLDAQQPFERDCYLWHPNPIYSQIAINQQWTATYQPISVANVVLEQLERIHESDENAYNNIQGAALFFRGYSHFTLAQVYAPPYEPEGNNDQDGLPLRLTSDLDKMSSRSSVKDTYEQIIADLTTALALLPERVEFATRPSKPAAAAALARTYLAIEDYDQALRYAEMALEWYDYLMDYNQVDENLAMPFARFNEETIFYTTAGGVNPLHPNRANVDTLLYRSYREDDRRKVLFFAPNARGTHSFKGTYAGFATGVFFSGLTSAELYLIVSECLVRVGKLQDATRVIKAFMKKRYEPGFLFPSFHSEEEFLGFILDERRKEMVFRGTRWSDLRRLNRDPRFSKTLSRTVIENGERVVYTLPPEDSRYTYLIPQEVIALTGMTQNRR